MTLWLSAGLLFTFAAFMAGYLSVLGGLSAVERVFKAVRLRTVAGIFFGFIGFFWARKRFVSTHAMVQGMPRDMVLHRNQPLPGNALWLLPLSTPAS